jgi:hypothetical protein
LFQAPTLSKYLNLSKIFLKFKGLGFLQKIEKIGGNVVESKTHQLIPFMLPSAAIRQHL